MNVYYCSSGHGRCRGAWGTCECFVGYKGARCETSDITSVAGSLSGSGAPGVSRGTSASGSGSGIGSADGDCFPGWAGPSCSEYKGSSGEGSGSGSAGSDYGEWSGEGSGNGSSPFNTTNCSTTGNENTSCYMESISPFCPDGFTAPDCNGTADAGGTQLGGNESNGTSSWIDVGTDGSMPSGMSVLPSIGNVMPTEAPNSGGYPVVVHLIGFQALNRTVVRFGDIHLENVDFLLHSNGQITVVSFQTPSTDPGVFNVTLTTVPCETQCSNRVTFSFTQRLSIQVVDQIPLKGPLQLGGTMTMDVVLKNLRPTVAISDFIVRFGIVALNVTKVTFSDFDLATMTVMVPSHSVAAVVDVLITIRNGPYPETVALKYRYFDGNALRTVTLAPTFVPVSRLVSGSTVWLRPEVAVTLANFPESLNVSSITVFCGESEAEVISIFDMNTCVEGAVVDCRRTKFVLRLPAVTSPGVRNITVSATHEKIVFGAIDYIEGCDFEKMCGESKVPDLLRLLATLTVVCDLTKCVDPNSLPPSEIVHVSSTQGLISGGESVHVRLLNFPFLHASGISVVFKTARFTRFANISGPSIAVGSSLQASEAQLHIITPRMVDDDVEIATVTLSATLGKVRKEASFVFEYLPLIQGPAVVNEFAPKTVRRTENLLLSVELANFPRIQMPFNASKIRVQLNDTDVSAKAVLSSTRKYTQVIVSVAKPLKGWKYGPLRLNLYHIEHGIERAASIDVMVVPTPPPKVISLFPSGGVSIEEAEVSLAIAYLDTEAEITVDGGASVLEAMPTHESACTERDCSSFELKLLLPAFKGNSTMPVYVQYQVVTGSVVASFKFRYDRPDTPNVKLVSPAKQTLMSEAGHEEIQVLISNFPTASCMAKRSCAQEAKGATIQFGDVAGVIKSLSNVESNGLLDIRIFAPSSVMQPQSVTVQVVQGEAAACFEYIYAMPPARVSPADAPLVGGVLVTITAVGFPSSEDIENMCKFHVSFGGMEAKTFLAVNHEFDHHGGRPQVKVAVLVPPVDSAGSVEGHLWLNCSHTFENTGEAVANFDFEYFRPPQVLRLVPDKVAVDRQSLVQAVVQNFPLFPDITHLQLTIGNRTCDGQLCAIKSFSHSASSTKFTIQVPSGMSEGPQMIRLEYIPPDKLDRSAKFAQAAVEYYQPLPTVLVARWCRKCNEGQACIAGGKCKNGEDPMMGAAELSDSISTDNVVSIIVENTPDFSNLIDSAGLVKQDSNMHVQVTFGGIVASLQRILISSTHRVVLQVQVPPDITTAGKVFLEVSLHMPPALPLNATTDFRFLDPKYTVSSSTKDFSSVDSAAFLANVTNLPVSKFGAADEIEIQFHGLSAKSFSVISFQAPSTLQLAILPPDLHLSRSDGTFGAVFMSISLRSDPSVSAQMQTFFWAPPDILSAEFDAKGTAIVVHFDQPTDSAGMATGDTDCANILVQTSLSVLGDISECVWKCDSSMSIMLGSGATIVPGFEIGVQNIRSRNGVSRPSTAVKMVSACPEPIAPSISIDAPAEVDPCSPLQIRAMAESPRALVYQWKCIDDVTLNQKLSLISGPLLSLNSGTPEMPASDRTYTIAVTAVDFQNIASEEVRFSVYKKSSPSPSVRFSPASLKTGTSESVLVRAAAAFSGCPVRKEAMNFVWKQLSGPALDPVYLKPQAQLYIPRGVLSPASQYTLEVTVEMESDPSISSRGKFTFEVASLPLIANIPSSKIEASTEKAFTLDGSDSRDLDIAAGSSQGLSFAWTCTLFDGSTTERCRDTTGDVLNFKTVAQIEIEKGVLAPTTQNPYMFTLTVSKGQKLPHTTSVPVVVLDRYVPTVNIRTSTARVKSDGSRMINVGEKVVLEGVCEDEGASLGWLISPQVDMHDLDSFPMGRQGTSLVIAPGASVLQEGSIYTFMFSCESRGNMGTASLDLEVNSAPRGGKCSACVADMPGCSKEGAALVDRFVMTCTDWADVDGPIEFQFGYELRSGVEAGSRLWFEKSYLPQKILQLPSGDIILMARVFDSYGASTQIMREHVVVSSSRRRVRGDSKFDRVIDAITSRLQTQDMSGVNELTATAAVEISLDLPADAVSIVRTLIKKLLFAQSSAVVNPVYQCECLQAAHKVTSLAAIQSPQSLQQATHLMHRLAQGQSQGVIAESCAKFAIDIVGRALTYQRNNQTTFGATFMSEMSSGLEHTLSKLGATLAHRESTTLSTHCSKHTMIKLLLAEFEARSLVLSSNGDAHDVRFPRGFATAAAPDVVHDPVVAYFRSHSFVPAMQSNLISVAPLVGVTLFKQNMQELAIAGLPNGILLTIPINTTGLNLVERENRKARLQCVYWDDVKGLYASSGCSIVRSNDSWAQCSCNHLTEITVVDDQGIVPCGDGVKHPGEACDDGNVVDCDGCNSRCEIENLTETGCVKHDAPMEDTKMTFFVTFQVVLPMAASDFSADKRLSFQRAIAAAAGVDSDQVKIEKVQVSVNRRSDRIEIFVSIVVNDGNAALSIVSRLTKDSINIQLSTVCTS